ncbi:uncharacterized protein LOC131259845 [Anopheles coustani]|uniref:uncharacterized protein LOC131259845 n=1 Tax=Anopheles coustani TaxID=139045 RepID=UPI0026588A36|nr:uncharacterized protein LOC131259845 [Anopheles coustani]
MDTAKNCDKSSSQLQAARLDSQLHDSQQPGGHFKDSFSAVSSKPNKNLPFECNLLEKPTFHKSAELSLRCSVDQLTHLSDNTLKPLTLCLSTSTGRRTSRRVAVKSNSYTRFYESFKYVCHFCKMSFNTFSELEIHGTTVNDGGSDKMCPWTENNRAFCLKALVRCFYCNELNTCEALRQHCSDRHSTKQFVCIDFWDSFKCGLCLYRNGSGSEKDFWLHFKNFHVKLWNKYTCYGYIDQLFLDWALNLGRNEQSSGSQPELKAIRFICNYCNESDTSEVSIGSHVARHWLKFNCVWCQKVFKYLKHLYYHAIAIHRMDDLEIGLTFSNEYDKHLLDVLMVFENGLILSKRQVQHTTMATLEHLKSGFQSYYNEQVKSTDSYKETLLMPIFTSRKSEVSTAETCKTFIQNQLLHLEIVLERVSNDHLEGKEN